MSTSTFTSPAIILVPATVYMSLFGINKPLTEDDHCEDVLVDNLDLLAPYVTQQGGKRGDLVHIEGVIGYRNSGVFAFDGTTIIDLDSDYNEYGTVPKQFQVITEFPIDYFSNTLGDHVWFDQTPYAEEMINTLTTDDGITHCSFTVNEVEYKLVFDNEDLPEEVVASFPDMLRTKTDLPYKNVCDNIEYEFELPQRVIFLDYENDVAPEDDSNVVGHSADGLYTIKSTSVATKIMPWC